MAISKLFRFPKKERNFVTAMGVFGNSNSLPISLVISLSKTLRGLHWDRVPGDSDDQVAARGILYLLIFQQLGQLLRWSWGYNVLLKPQDDDLESSPDSTIDQGAYTDESPLVDAHAAKDPFDIANEQLGSHSPVVSSSSSNPVDSLGEGIIATPANGNAVTRGAGNMAGRDTTGRGQRDSMTQFPSYRTIPRVSRAQSFTGSLKQLDRLRISADRKRAQIWSAIHAFFAAIFRRLPTGLQKALSTMANYVSRFFLAIYVNMNPPLWALLIAIIVASIPTAQHALFDHGTFLNNSVARAIAQSGGVAVPLILLVLGANLARNTIPQEQLATTPTEKREERNLLIACLLVRMLLPTILITPFLALLAKYVPISILDDPIFVIVCFLLTGAPSALQLAQICQLHNVFTGVMSRLLFQSYVVWYVFPLYHMLHFVTFARILPSTLVLVMLALEVVEWAAV